MAEELRDRGHDAIPVDLPCDDDSAGLSEYADAVVDGESGLLVDDVAEFPNALERVLGNEVLRSRLSKGALARARWFTWDATARRALEALAGEVPSSS